MLVVGAEWSLGAAQSAGAPVLIVEEMLTDIVSVADALGEGDRGGGEVPVVASAQEGCEVTQVRLEQRGDVRAASSAHSVV
ncbi:hypothetical protein NY547_07460 [Cnuibacter physcomitrellae]|uniref:hypothetical protein n=1 Tax=Cnuibacter physcomitrellae TaxID=1619308 RepID=UPI002175C66C|nr:hypothetical protein [Cnuibacter physcomitrellae]MCS5497069.1 hypothetical protein [Cnuibacter physcomitrellae]